MATQLSPRDPWTSDLTLQRTKDVFKVNLSFDHTTPRKGIQIGLLETPYSEQHNEEGNMINSTKPLDTVFAISIPKIRNIL